MLEKRGLSPNASFPRKSESNDLTALGTDLRWCDGLNQGLLRNTLIDWNSTEANAHLPLLVITVYL